MKVTKKEVEEETKVLEKVFDVVRILDGEALQKMQNDPCMGGYRSVHASVMISGRRTNHARIAFP